MENATKALLIAAAIILLTMILSLLVIAYGQTSDFFQKQSDSNVVEQLERFNKQFDNYNGTTIRGNEMLSMINKVIDYNTLQAEDNGYDKIKLIIKGIDSEDIKNQFKNESSDAFILNLEEINTEGTKEISETVTKLLDMVNDEIPNITESQLQTLAANISEILIDNNPNMDSERNKYNLKQRNTLIKKILKVDVENNSDLLEKIQNVTKQYYQLVQFKRAYFKCTNIEHSNNTGRVIKMQFELVVDNGNVKFD